METIDTSKLTPQEMPLVIDPSAADYRELCEAASKVESLLAVPEIQADAAALATLDLFVGGIASLLRAANAHFKDRTGRPIGAEPVRIVAEQLAKGTMRNEGAWLAGYHFNSGLLRIAGAFHRGLKIALVRRVDTRRREFPPALAPAAAGRYQDAKGQPWAFSNLMAVYNEVNNIKHTADGTFQRRQADFKQATEAVGELVQLFQLWNDAGRPT